MDRKQMFGLVLFVSIMMIMVFISGCATTLTGNIAAKQNNKADDEIKIGAILILSGTGSNWGVNSQKGIELAIEDLNSNGGVRGKKLSVVYEDNPDNNPKTAVDALHKLLSQDIYLIVGPSWVTSSLAAAPLACERKAILISPSDGSPEFTKTCDYIYDLWSVDDLLSKSLSKYMYEHGFRKIAILGSQDSWERLQAGIVKESFENLGGEVVSYQITQANEQDFRTESIKIKESGAEAVVFTNFAFEHLSAKRLRESGYDKQFFSILLDYDRIKSSQGAFEGAIVANSFTPTTWFYNKFLIKYHDEPDAGSDSAYDAVMLFAKAINATNSTNATIIKDYLATIKSYAGASGNLKITDVRGVEKPPIFTMVKNNKLIQLEN